MSLTCYELSGSTRHFLKSLQVKDEVSMKTSFSDTMHFSETVANMQGYRTLALNRGRSYSVSWRSWFQHATDRDSFLRKPVCENAIDEVVQCRRKRSCLLSNDALGRVNFVKAEEGHPTLRNLLLLHLKGRVLGLTRFRTGAKLVVDATGKCLG